MLGKVKMGLDGCGGVGLDWLIDQFGHAASNTVPNFVAAVGLFLTKNFGEGVAPAGAV